MPSTRIAFGSEGVFGKQNNAFDQTLSGCTCKEMTGDDFPLVHGA